MTGASGGIDYSAWQFWLNVGQVGGYVVLGLYVWFTNRQKATVAEINAVREKVEGKANAAEIKAVQEKVEGMEKEQAIRCGTHMNRTTTLEVKVENAPTHKDLGEVFERINAVKGSVDSMCGSLKGVSTQVNLLVEHHLKGERK